MRNIVLYQYDKNTDSIKRDEKFIIERTTLTYDQKPDKEMTYAVSTTLPKRQLVVAPNPGEVYDFGDGLYRLWLDNVDDAAAAFIFDKYLDGISNSD